MKCANCMSIFDVLHEVIDKDLFGDVEHAWVCEKCVKFYEKTEKKKGLGIVVKHKFE